jgi:general secretion pathway protein G
VELMVVLAIIGLLAGVVTLSVRPYLTKAKQTTARREIATICAALESFNIEFGRYPTTEEGLEILRKPNEKFSGPLLTQDPMDPWGSPYEYNQPGRDGPYEVLCYGADGREGGRGADADIVSGKLKSFHGQGGE